ncbi:RNA polymerase subunit sigma-24, partial [Streptomyces sp. NPDC052287]
NPMVLLSVDTSERGIERIMWVMNPDKLGPYVASLSA